MSGINFLGKDGTFSIERPENYSYLYFPIAGEHGIKSALSPNLGGDIKINQNAFLMEPVSVENLHNNRSGRNFWCRIEGEGAWSVTGASAEEESRKFSTSQDKSTLTAGFMWQTVTRESEQYHMQAKVTSFVPLEHNVEIMHVDVAFTCAYAGNLLQMAELLLTLESRFGWKDVELLEECRGLLQTDSRIYDDVAAKRELLADYLVLCRHNVSGRKIRVPIWELADNLKNKAEFPTRGADDADRTGICRYG